MYKRQLVLTTGAGAGVAAAADDLPPKRRANPVFFALAADEAAEDAGAEDAPGVAWSAARFAKARKPLTFHVTILVRLVEEEEEESAETRARLDGGGTDIARQFDSDENLIRDAVSYIEALPFWMGPTPREIRLEKLNVSPIL